MTSESAFHNKYSLVKGAARRARQLQSGASPLIAAKSMKACRVAQDEIRQGHVKFVLPDRPAEPTLDVTVHWSSSSSDLGFIAVLCRDTIEPWLVTWSSCGR